MDFLKRFWAYFLSLGAVAGLYFAIPEDVSWIFAAVVGLAVILAGAARIARRVVAWGQSIREYPRLLQRVAAADEENRELRVALSEAERQNSSIWDDAREEGRKEVTGALLAVHSGVTPQIKAVVPGDGATPRFLARCAAPGSIVGARFLLQARETGIRRGVVEVISHDEETGLVELLCVERTSEAFWRHLAAQAEVSEAPPTDVALAMPTLDIMLDPEPAPSADIEVSENAEDN